MIIMSVSLPSVVVLMYLALGCRATCAKPKFQDIELFPENFQSKPVNFDLSADEGEVTDLNNKVEFYPIIPGKQTLMVDSDGHQIYKRNLNRDYPNQGMNGTVYIMDSDNTPITYNNLNEANGLFQSDIYPQLYGRENLEEAISGNSDLDNVAAHERNPNWSDGIREVSGYNADAKFEFYLPAPSSNVGQREGEVVYLDGSKDYLDYLERNNFNFQAGRPEIIFKRDSVNSNSIQVESKTNETDVATPSTATKAIVDEIDKVYKDLSDNVNLLADLRDRESRLTNETKKRWAFFDSGVGGSSRNKRDNEDLTVELETKDTKPNSLDHIERKIDEEVLQVNVPLKFTH